MYIFSEIMAFIEEFTNQSFSASASPGFTWGRSGSVPASTWLQNDTVPSNVTGRNVFLANAKIKKVFISNQDANIIKIGIYSHDGDGISLSLITTVTTAAIRTSEFTVNFSISKGKQIAMKIEDDSPSGAKNIVAGILMSGNLV